MLSLPFATYNVAARRWFIAKRPIPETLTLDLPKGMDWLDFMCEVKSVLDSMGIDFNTARVPSGQIPKNVTFFGLKERI